MKLLGKLIEENKIELEEGITDVAIGLLHEISNILGIDLKYARGIFNKLKFSKENNVLDSVVKRYSNEDNYNEVHDKMENIYSMIQRA